MERRLSFDETMSVGQAEYQDVIDALTAHGLPATFTQTGGMNAALEVLLDGGSSLLITDADDSLSWNRHDQQGWGVGLFAPPEQYDGGCLASARTDSGDVSSLIRVIDEVLRAAAGRAT